MICTRSSLTFGLALALALAGCSGIGGSAGSSEPNPEIAGLLEEAQSLMVDGALADAGRKLDEARGLAPDDPDLWVAIAKLRYRGGEHFTALEAADRALALGPDHAPALVMRALLVRDAHGFAAALPWFESALAADPGNREVWAEYAATLGDSGSGSNTLKAVAMLAEAAPDDPRIPFYQAVIAARAGDLPVARSLLARSGMVTRGVPAAMMLDAVISLKQGNPGGASEILEQLAARQPGNVRVRELLAKALLQSGREDEVIARFAAEVTKPESSPYLVAVVARAYERSGDRAKAAPLLASAYGGTDGALAVLSLRPGLPQPTAELRGFAGAGNWAGASANAAALRDRFPQSADVASLAGDARLGAGDPAAALETYALAVKVKRPWPLTRRAVLAYRQAGDELAADTLLARHVGGEPNMPSALFALAERQAEQGEWGRTALLLDHAMALGGAHDPALLTLRLRAARALDEAGDVRRFALMLAEVRPNLLTRP